MKHAIYDELVPWYRLLDATDDHEGEALVYQAAFERAVPGCETLLELGAGAGNNAFYLKDHFACTLTDISEPMLSLSREINPECEHELGDMRTLRLGKTFDVVLAHDSIVYMTTEAELAAAAATAFVHTRAGGAAIFAPDSLLETYRETSDLHEGFDEHRGLRCLEWSWRPDPSIPTFTVDYAFLLRDATGIRAVHDRHVEGLFHRATWERILTAAGFAVEPLTRPIDNEHGAEHPFTETIFLGRRPL